ncbi:MAG: GHMP kinase [Lentisphaerae bacterium RIFOXYB12_FULL_65_16]|nr:MAG: GHMP kinase [Lentisphaerae bacterium RIFOXYA12_64_32]OGV86980.1 MAG: GHMP kinase [Lentisphaerae bacterium RIFOXYB12_FULL_65_16]
MNRTFDIFVPGRVCLFGEHSDWAGGHRRFNSQVLPGRVIIAGTNQGIFARTSAHRDAFIFRSTLPDGTRPETCILPMDKEALLQRAESGDFFSYAAGVAYYMLTFYEVGGIEVDNYKTTLPVKKGLSSSAALCVLVARAFNKVYDLKLTTRAEMEAAYQGEIMTPSRCGRMDQGCAFGQVPVVMTFDGELLKASRLGVHQHIRMLIADLKGQKNTIRILADLNRAYPFAQDETGRNVQAYLGKINTDVVVRAAAALDKGDAAQLGALMNEAQAEFDRHLMPACPEELTAVKLHTVLADPEVKRLTYGGKGVGSQGDGCVQFVVRDDDSRRGLGEYLERRYGMECFQLDLKPPQTVRKAVIPVAGFGTRMFPASKALKKELFPVITPDGVAKPILLTIIEEALQSGIEEIAVVVRAGDEAFFQNFFRTLPPPDFYNRLPEKAKEHCQTLQELGDRLTFITQDEQQGFGHAVFCARDWVGNEPFLLLLGDHMYVSDTDVPCSRQLIDAFETNGRRSVIGAYVAEADEVSHYGTVTGKWLNDKQRLLDISELAEKPSLDYARNNLVTPGLAADRFLCIYGQYVLPPSIFAHLQREVDGDIREAGEIQLTTGLELQRREEGMLGLVVDGVHYDTGLPETYLNSLVSFYTGRPTKLVAKKAKRKR